MTTDNNVAHHIIMLTHRLIQFPPKWPRSSMTTKSLDAPSIFVNGIRNIIYSKYIASQQ
jgi:hypothetical protein